MEEQLSPLAVTHLLQHTLRSLCIHENSKWVYAVFWRILPRNYPPPRWDSQGGAYDMSRGNRRNWILVWEDGFCNFAATTTEINNGDCPGSSAYGSCEYQQYQGLQSELFFKMSHEIYNYGEGLIGRVAADRSHKWIYRESNDREMNLLSGWHSSADSHPRTWEAQFLAGIKTIALIAVREGVIQLGAVHRVIEDPTYVAILRKKFSYIESIPGVLFPHPSSSAYTKIEGYSPPEAWQLIQGNPAQSSELCDQFNQRVRITPSMSSLEALLSKLPSVVPESSPSVSAYCEYQPQYLTSNRSTEVIGLGKVAKEEVDHERDLDESISSSLLAYHQHFGNRQA